MSIEDHTVSPTPLQDPLGPEEPMTLANAPRGINELTLLGRWKLKNLAIQAGMGPTPEARDMMGHMPVDQLVDTVAKALQQHDAGEKVQPLEPPKPPEPTEEEQIAVEYLEKAGIDVAWDTRGEALRKAALGDAEVLDLSVKPKPIEYVAEALLPRGGVSMIAGPGGSKKSWLALHLALAVATGSRLLDCYATQASPCVYLNFDSAMTMVHNRAYRLITLNGAPTDNLQIIRPTMRMEDPCFFDWLMGLGWAAPGCPTFIIDTLRSACPTVDENCEHFASDSIMSGQEA